MGHCHFSTGRYWLPGTRPPPLTRPAWPEPTAQAPDPGQGHPPTPILTVNPISVRLLATPIRSRGAVRTPLRSRVLTSRFLKFKRHSFRLNMIYISKSTSILKKNTKEISKIRRRGVLGGGGQKPWISGTFLSRITGTFVNRFWSNKWQSIGNE